MKYRRLIALFFALLLILCACKGGSDVRVSEKALARLREEYPYNDQKNEVLGQYYIPSEFYTFEGYIGRESNDLGVVVEIIGDWYDVYAYDVSIYDDPELDAMTPPGAGDFHYRVIDAEVTRVLWGALSEGDTITLSFGPAQRSENLGLEDIYVEGQRLICLAASFPDNPFDLENLCRTSKDYTYYITKNDVVLSVVSFEGADVASGMYLETFAQQAAQIRAELTVQPEPPAVTE